jgi:arylsulfatase A-like enzyme
MQHTMHRDHYSKLIALCVLGCLALKTTAVMTAVEPARPNILWFVSEDNNPRLGCYGDKLAQTPNIDRLASEGVLYRNAFANAPVCAATRSTLITGIYATSLGTQNMRSRYPVPDDIRFYSQSLHDAGYHVMNPGKTDYNIRGNDKSRWDQGQSWADAPAGKPWMLIINTAKTHESSLHRATVQSDFLKVPFQFPLYHPDTPEIRSGWIQYYHQITQMDAELGEVLKKLERDGLADDTIVFYYSDHGGVLPRSKRFCYDSGLRVPLVVRFGKNFQHLAPAAPGAKLDRLVSEVDLGPSLLSLAGAQIPAQFQGEAFLGPKAAPPREYTFGFRNRMDECYDLMRTVRDQQFRYIHNYMPHRIYGQHLRYLWQMPATVSWEQAYKAGQCNATQSAFWQPKPSEELYDEQADPDEVKNLAGDPKYQAVLERMRKANRDWILKSRDTGFATEADMLRRADGGPVRTMAQDDKRYPLERILAAAELASDRSAVGAVPKLVNLMSDPDPAVRCWAALGCCVHQGQASSATDALRKLLKDPSPSVRITAAEALCGLGRTEEGLATLVAALRENDAWDVLLALNALEALGDSARPAADSLAAQPITSGNAYVTSASEWLLEKFGKIPAKVQGAGKKGKADRTKAKPAANVPGSTSKDE